MRQNSLRSVWLFLNCLAISFAGGVLAEAVEIRAAWDSNPLVEALFYDLPQIFIGGLLIFLMALLYRGRASRAQVELEDQRERLRRLVDGMPHGLVEIDHNGRLLLANPAYIAMLGCSEASLLGAPVWRSAADPAQASLLRDALEAGAGSAGSATPLMRAGDGSVREIRFDWARRDTESGPALMAVATDVTAHRRATRRLQDIEQRYQALFEFNPDPVYLVDTQGRYLDRNRAAEALSGHPNEVMLGQPIEQVVCEKDHAQVRDTIEKVNQGVAQRLQVNGKDKNGRRLCLDVTVVPIIVDGGVTGIFGLTKDMTEQVEAAQRLQESEERYRAIFEPNPDAIYTLDPCGRFTSVNPATAELTGYPVEALIGRPFPPLIAPEDAERIQQHFEQALRGDPQHLSLKLVRADGRTIFVDVTAAPYVVAGVVQGVAGITKDITARVIAELQLRESERRYRSLFDRSLDGIILLGAGGRDIVAANPAACRMLGSSAEQLMRQGCSALVHAGDLAYGETVAAMQSDKGFHGELRFQHAEGETIPVEASGAVFEDRKDRSTLGIVFRDIRERKAAQAQLAASQEELRRLAGSLQAMQEAERRRVAYELHDELGQCLTGLKLDVNWLRQRLPAAAPASVAAKLGQMDATIDGTVESVRRLARNLRPTILDDLGLPAACEWLVQEFRQRSGLESHITLPQQEIALPEAVATACFRIVQEALTNITRHAYAARVDVHLQHGAEGLRLIIADDGIGTAEEALRKPTLGLVGMRERARGLGGNLDIHSAPEEGTRILVWFPPEALRPAEAA